MINSVHQAPKDKFSEALEAAIPFVQSEAERHFASSHDCDEYSQEVLLRAWRNRSDAHGNPDQFRAWLKKVCRFVALKMYQKLKKNPVLSVDVILKKKANLDYGVILEDDQCSRRIWDALLTDPDAVITTVDAPYLRRVILSAIRQLSDEQHTAMDLLIQGNSFNDIARIMNDKTAKAAKSLCTKAIEELRTILQGHAT